jgi:hypothetical protein
MKNPETEAISGFRGKLLFKSVEKEGTGPNIQYPDNVLFTVS